MLAELISVLKKLRILLLKQGNKELYREINYFLASPSEVLEYIDNDIDIFDIKEDKRYINFLKDQIYKFYVQQEKEYYSYVINGQCDVWDQMYKAYFSLLDLKKQLNDFNIDYIDDNYILACDEVKKVIQYFSSSISTVTRFEREMGLDRYLSYINKEDLELLYTQIQQIKDIANKKLNKYKDYFQVKWSISSVSKVIEHMLIKKNIEHPVTRNVWTNQEKIICFLIDGFGYSQFLWNKQHYDSSKSYTFNENILNWLETDINCKQGFILGSSLNSDTGAGLAQIFTGKLPKETGVMASKVYRQDYEKFYHYNSRYKSPIIDIKKVKNCFDELVNTSLISSFVQDFKARDINTHVYYCAQYKQNPFSELCFNGASVQRILPPERVFSILFDEINKNKDKGLHLIYYTALDNTGHPAGAFTSFELYEHQKINFLLTNFIVQLVVYKPELFDGKTSIVITADHGMAESSKKVISRKAFERLYPSYLKNTKGIVENNRGILFYNVKDEKIKETCKQIEDIFNENGVTVQVFNKHDNIVKDLLYDDNELTRCNCPDIVALIEGEGIVYSKRINKNLYHYGGHGGRSLEEVFVPLICINLSEDLKEKIIKRFLKLT